MKHKLKKLSQLAQITYVNESGKCHRELFEVESVTLKVLSDVTAIT